MAKGFKLSKKMLMIGGVVLVVIVGGAMMLKSYEGFEGDGVERALSGAGKVAKSVVGNTVGLAASGVEGVARVADVAVSAVADGARNFGSGARNFARGSSMGSAIHR